MEPIIAIAAVAGVVWGAGFVPAHTFLGPVPLTSDRILWTLLMVQLLFFWRMGLTAQRQIGASEWLLLAFVGVLAVSVFCSGNDWTVNKNLPASRLVFYYLMPVGMYLVGWQARITERGLKIMFLLLGIFGVYLALTAAAEIYGMTDFVFPRYINSDTADLGEFLGRGRGPLLNPMANGMLMGLCLGAGLMLWPRTPNWGKSLLVGFAGLLCYGIYCTLTRSAWMGGFVGLLILVYLALPRPNRRWLIAATVVGSVLFVATQWENLLEYKRDKYQSARAAATSAELRPVLAAIAWEMFRDRPLLGCGLGHYPDQHVNYLANRDVDVPLEQGRPYVQHNVWLSLLTETGLVGVTLFTLLLLAWLRSAWRLWQAGDAPLWMRQQGLLFLVLMANYCMNGMFQDMSICTMVHMVLFFMAGVTVNLDSQVSGEG